MGKATHRLIGKLFEGPLDIVGDVHGEHDALMTLLDRLGHDPRRSSHPEGRRLVFVGDLVDRGPDSPGVIDTVRELCDRGQAQCVLGNHELNLLRNDLKHGNAWFLQPDHKEQTPDGEFAHSRLVDAHHKGDVLEFLTTLPLLLERQDLRVLHAAWHPKAIEDLRSVGTVDTVKAFDHFEALIEEECQKKDLVDKAREEIEPWSSRLTDPNITVPLLPAVAEWDVLRQMGNPLRVLTSGIERRAARPRYISGKWRMCDRVPWWNEYDDSTRVVFGHYWRRLHAQAGSDRKVGLPALFEGTSHDDWLGPRRNAYCVDFSVGERYKERRSNATCFDTALRAVRLPEGLHISDRES